MPNSYLLLHLGDALRRLVKRPAASVRSGVLAERGGYSGTLDRGSGVFDAQYGGGSGAGASIDGKGSGAGALEGSVSKLLLKMTKKNISGYYQ